ncbi:hypothetical protein [Nonomuraea indica]|uniref:hypothetical protein n=1 Tax=Nonomuraea indica TaxID=1581193 RepID=UPI000C7A5DF3|nr:hypothetical protein [Nonomuraea indica]
MSQIQPSGIAELAQLRRMLAARHDRRAGAPSTRNVVTGYRDHRGRPVKVTVDQLGNIVHERWTGQDAFVFLPLIRVRRHIEEVR